MEFYERIENSMRNAGVTPRVAYGVTGITYTTIYNYIRARGSIKLHATNRGILEQFVDTLDKMVEEGELPLSEESTVQDKIDFIKNKS